MYGKSPHSTGLCPLLGPLPKKGTSRPALLPFIGLDLPLGSRVAALIGDELLLNGEIFHTYVRLYVRSPLWPTKSFVSLRIIILTNLANSICASGSLKSEQISKSGPTRLNQNFPTLRFPYLPG